MTKYTPNFKFSLSNLIFGIVFVLANIRATLFVQLYFLEKALVPKGFAWLEILLWVIVLLLIFKDILKRKQIRKYWDLLHQNKVLFWFLVFAGFSVIWSVSVYATIFRWLELLFATLTAMYFAIQYRLLFFWSNLLKAGVLFVLISIIFSISLPIISSPQGYPYYGAWQGIFWHKNHFGVFVAFINLLCLFFTSHYYRISDKQYFFWGGLYVITLWVVYLSKSATALLTVLILSLCFFLLKNWLLFKHKLKKIHYYFIGIIFLLFIFVGYLEIDYIFALIGKERTLTGRLSLWNYLFENVIFNQIWIGHGYGAFWEVASNRITISKEIGWSYAVLIGDSGYLDIFIHLGIIGLTFFLIVFIFACKQAIQIAYEDLNNPLAFLPLFFLAYALLVNISFSLFIETEMLVWIIILQICLYKKG